jgi:hypothetical protein
MQYCRRNPTGFITKFWGQKQPEIGGETTVKETILLLPVQVTLYDTFRV